MRLTCDRTDGGSVIHSDSTIFGAAQRDRGEGRPKVVKLSGEFDVSCPGAFRHALRGASGLGRRTFVDLAGVTFMDARCLRELASWCDAAGAGPLELCRTSWQSRLGAAACGLKGSLDTRPDDDPGYKAVISEVCACKWARRTPQPREHLLLARISS